jgi:hypothetical protein
MIAFLSLAITVVLICIFIGMFMRLGRIERVLIKMAIHQGAIPPQSSNNDVSNHIPSDVYGPGSK